VRQTDTNDFRNLTAGYLRNILEHQIIRKKWWEWRGATKARKLENAKFMSLFPYSQTSEEFIEEFGSAVASRFYFHPRNIKPLFLHLIEKTQPYDEIVDEAEKIMSGKFNALGYDWNIGAQINWQKDYKSGFVWDLAPSGSIDVLQLGSESDVKYAWEPARFHMVWQIGKAYWFSGHERYAEKFVSLVNSWIDANPCGYGIHWANPMEAAIRACNWISGYYFFTASKTCTSNFMIRMFKSLYQHGLYIRNNLEYTRRSGNHLISNFVGLLMLGIFFRKAEFGKKWVELAVDGLETEILRQVSVDGVHYEKSIGYHRFVAELFAAAARLCTLNGIELSLQFCNRMKAMFAYMKSYTRPDGSVPNIGDSDDSMLFRVVMDRDDSDHRHILCLGVMLYRSEDFKSAVGPYQQNALWLFGPDGFDGFLRIDETNDNPLSSAYPEGGMYFMQSKEAHISIDAGELGKFGWGGHGHNDTLSFELWWQGYPILIDSGTYTYSGSVAERNKFRGTAAHNTARVDGNELAKLTDLWRSDDKTDPKVLKWICGEEEDVLIAEHSGFARFPGEVVHRRTYRLRKRRMEFSIEDQFLGSGEHSLEVFFHFHPYVFCKKPEGDRIILDHRGVSYVILGSPGEWKLSETEYSPSYGLKQKNTSASISQRAQLPFLITTVIKPWSQ
jgi:hypothetical protein